METGQGKNCQQVDDTLVSEDQNTLLTNKLTLENCVSQEKLCAVGTTVLSVENCLKTLHADGC